MHNLLSRITSPPPRRLCVALLAAGLFLGSLLGPAFLGRAAPQWYEALWIGGVDEQRALDAHEQDVAAAVARLEAVDVTPIAVAERLDREAQVTEQLQADLAAARAAHAATIDRIHLLITVAVMLAAALTVLGLGRWTYVVLAAAVAAWTVVGLGAGF